MRTHCGGRLTRWRGGDETQQCDFRRRAEAIRRAPVSCAATDVDPQAIQAMQPRGEWLLKAYKQIPGPELAAVSMTGELQIETRTGRGQRRAGLVSEQDFCARICRGAGKCSSRVATLRGVEMMSAVVRDSGHDERSASMSYDDVLVQEHAQPQAPELRHPGPLTGVVFVISCDQKRAVACFQPSQRRNVPREIVL